jgi:hypothetical protein
VVDVPKPLPKRDLDEWDAEIEAEFLRVTQQSKTSERPRRKSRHIGCPIEYMAEVCRKTEGRTALVVAQYIYRRTVVCKATTVTLSADDLTELGVSRRRKLEALAKLQKAGLIEVELVGSGRSGKVTLLWTEGNRAL